MPTTLRNRVRRMPYTSKVIYCCVSSAWVVCIALLWLCVGGASALANITAAQCELLLFEFQHTFVKDGDGYPSIDSCNARVVRLMWAQQIQRVYASGMDTSIDSYDDLRHLPDAQFAKLVINAAAGSLMDSTQQSSDDTTTRIRVDQHGHFQRYVLNDSNRVTALQTMLVLSIVTLAVTWWRIEMRKDLEGPGDTGDALAAKKQ